MNRQSRALLVLVLVGGLLGWGWWSSRSSGPGAGRREPIATERPVRGGRLVSSVRAEPRSFNRLVSRDFVTEVVSLLTHGRLVRVNRATQQVEPWLAERWTTSADGRVFTLTLRDGLRWSDGQPFTAADVDFTFRAIADPATKSVLGSALQVDGQPVRVATPDPATVVVTLPQPFGPGIRLLDNIAIMPRHRLEPALAAGTLAQAWSPTTPPADLVGMGPFRLVRYEAGQRLVFERNPHYWRRDDGGEALPYLDGVVLEIVPDQNAELLRLQAGELDMTQQHLRAEDYATVRELERQGSVRLLELGVGLDPDVFFFNLRPSHWARDPRRAWLPTAAFRQALSHAVDREGYANTVFLGAAVPIHGPVSPGNREWFWPDLPRYRFDRDAATGLLTGLDLANRDADAFLEDPAGTEARFTMLTYRGNTALERGAQVLKESFERIGVAVDVVPLEPGALIERMLAGQFDAIFFNYVATDTDPAMQRDFWLSSGSAHIWNIAQATPATEWERRIDQLMTRQAASVDPAERTALFREALRIFSDELPALYFAAPRLYVGVNARVRHLTPALTRPPLLWSIDTMAVAPPAASR
ncbi:MAG: ABC transporter substrate-binding protein [Vicinamibacterales bacterium]